MFKLLSSQPLTSQSEPTRARAPATKFLLSRGRGGPTLSSPPPLQHHVGGVTTRGLRQLGAGLHPVVCDKAGLETQLCPQLDPASSADTLGFTRLEAQGVRPTQLGCLLFPTPSVGPSACSSPGLPLTFLTAAPRPRPRIPP